jgi:dTDP-glucose 4,6-dehydratase
MTKKTVLLTGMGGFISSHCMSHILVNTDWNIVGLDSWNHKGISERIADNLHYINHMDRVKVYTHDLNAPLSDVLINKIGKVEYIINFASASHVDRSITDPIPFVKNNVNIALNMLEYAREVSPDKYINIGTDEVYGPTDGVHQHKEWDVIRPSNPYSASKAMQEDASISWWRTYGVPVILTNIMNTIGETQDSEKFIPMVIKKILAGEEISIHSDKQCKISGARFWLHARNTSDALLFLLNNVFVHKYPQHDRPERFNIAGEEQITNLDMALMIAKIIGKKLKYKLVDAETSRPGHDLYYGLDGAKLRSYGYHFPINLHESLERTVRWTLENQRWLK